MEKQPRKEGSLCGVDTHHTKPTTSGNRKSLRRAKEATLRNAMIKEEYRNSHEGRMEERVRTLCEISEGGHTVPEEGIQKVLQVLRHLGPILNIKGRTQTIMQRMDRIVRGVVKAYRIGSEIFDEADAAAWGGDFCLREQAGIMEDERRLHEECEGSLEKLCALKQAAMAADRLSVERVMECLPDALVDSPSWPDGRRDREAILDVAKKMRMLLPDGFVPNLGPNPKRAVHLKVATAINKQMYGQWKKDLLIILNTETARKIPGVHFSATSWAPKKGVAAGRPIGDPSNAPRGQSSLNDRELHGKLEELWGPIKHPTLEDICLMILAMVDKYGWEDITLWKMDLKGAFTLMFFKEEVVKYLAFELTEDLTMLHIVGFFGWTGTPFAFEAITRVLRHYVGALIEGLLKMYVDDLIGVSRSKKVQADMDKARVAITQLLGKNAIAEEKTELGRVLEAIGWRINLDTRTVTMSSLNLAKTVYAFFMVKEGEPMDIKELEGLASRAARCAQVCRAMRPYKVALYDALKGKDRNSRVGITLGEEAQVDVWMWRIYLATIECDPLRMERTIASFRTEPPELVISFDASLTGYGVGISTVPLGGAQGDAWSTLVAYTALEVPFALGGKSHYQNNCEFVAVIIGMWLAGRMGYKGVSYILKGDSISALQWAKEDRAQSMICRRASICFSLISIHLDLRVAETIHVPGVENIICDGLSRGKLGSEVGLPIEKYRDFQSDARGMEFLRECDPLAPLEGGVKGHTEWIEGLLMLLSCVG